MRFDTDHKLSSSSLPTFNQELIITHLITVLKKQLETITSAPTVEEKERRPQLLSLLQVLTVLLTAVEEQSVVTSQVSAVIANVIPVTQVLLKLGYGNTAARYHDWVIRLAVQYPESLQEFLASHHMAKAEISKQVFTDHLNENDFHPNFAASGAMLESLRHCNQGLIHTKNKSTSTYHECETALDCLEQEFLYQHCSITFLDTLTRLTKETSTTTLPLLAKSLDHVMQRLSIAVNPKLAWSLAFKLYQTKTTRTQPAFWRLSLLQYLQQAVTPTTSSSIALASSPSTKIDGDWQRYRRQLEKIRQPFFKDLPSTPPNNSSTVMQINSIQKNYQTGLLNLLQTMIADINHCLGPAPTGLEFCLVALGSTSRFEALPYSDLECLCLVNDMKFTAWEEGATPENRYLQAWYQCFQFKMISLSESQGLRLDEDAITKGHPGDINWRGTPTFFLTKVSNATEDFAFRHSLLTGQYLGGNEEGRLYNQYQQELPTTLNKIMRPLAQQLAKNLQVNWALKTDKTSVKTFYWEPLIYLIQALHWHYQGKAPASTQAALEILTETKTLAPVFAQECQTALATLYWLRAHQQQKILTIVTPEITSSLADLRNYVLTPLYYTLNAWLISQTFPADPLQYFVEQLLKTQQFSEDSNVELAALAYAQVTRMPSGFTTSQRLEYFTNTYRLLPRAQRGRYVFALEKMLIRFKIENPTQIVEALGRLPDQTGWRLCHEDMEKIWHQALGRLFTTLAPSKAKLRVVSAALSSTATTPILRYALPEAMKKQILQFDASGKWRIADKPKGQRGRHTVLKLSNGGDTFAVKIVPEQPGTEYAVCQLARRVSGETLLSNWFVGLQDSDGNTITMQLFPYVEQAEEQHLESILTKTPELLTQLEPDCFTRLLLRVLLMNPEDDKGDDYLLIPVTHPDGSKTYRLLRIDNERAFYPIEETKEAGSFLARTRKTLLVKSILYCLNTMQEPLYSPVIDEFLQLDPYSLLVEWLSDLQACHNIWQVLLDDKAASQQVNYKDPRTQQPLPGFPVILLPPNIEKELLNRLTLMQEQLKQHRQSQQKAGKSIQDLTGLDLLRTVQPALADYYETGFKSTPYDAKQPALALKRFAQLVDDPKAPLYQRNPLGYRQSQAQPITAITQSLRLAVRFTVEDLLAIRKGQHLSVKEALRKLVNQEAPKQLSLIEQELLKCNETALVTFQHLTIRQQVMLIERFHKTLEAQPEPEDLKESDTAPGKLYTPAQQQFLLRAYQQTPFTRLVLSGFHQVLTDAYLEPLLKAANKHLTHLDLSRCTLLSESILAKINDHCPNLRSLILQGLPWKNLHHDNGFWNKDTSCHFPYLRMLNITGCPALETIQLIPGPLDKLRIEVQNCKPEGLANWGFFLCHHFRLPKTQGTILLRQIANGQDVIKYLITCKWDQPNHDMILALKRTKYFPIKFEKNYDYLVKVLLCGDCRAGKTTLLLKLTENIFERAPAITTGFDLFSKEIKVNNIHSKLMIWDTAGAETSDINSKILYKETHIFIVCFDLTDKSSFNHIKEWLKKVEKNGSDKNAGIILAGLKADLLSSRVVNRDEAQCLADEKSIPYFECSAKTGLGVNELFYYAAITQLQRFTPSKFLKIKNVLYTLDLVPEQASLHIALSRNDLPIIENYLKERAIDWKALGPSGCTVFLQAIYYGRLYWVKQFLLAHDPKKLWSQRDQAEQPAGHIAMAGNLDALSNTDTMFDFIVEQKQLDFRTPGTDGRTIFLEAVYRQSLKWMQKLLQLSNDPISLWSQQDIQGQKAATLLIQNHEPSKSDSLISFAIGCKQIDFITEIKSTRRTIFLEAAFQGKIEWIHSFLSLADPSQCLLWSQRSKDGETAIHLALKERRNATGHNKVIDLAAEQKQIDFIAKGQDDRTIFLEAAYQGQLQWMKQFLKITKSNKLWSQRGKNGKTAIHYVLQSKSWIQREECSEIIEFAFEQKQIDPNVQYVEGRTLFLEAAYRGELQWMKRLLVIADPQILWSQRSNKGQTTIHLAIPQGEREWNGIIYYFSKNDRWDGIIEFAIEQKQIDFDARDKDGNTIFLKAANERQVNWMQRFLQLAPDSKVLWSQRNDKGETALKIAESHSHNKETLKFCQQYQGTRGPTEELKIKTDLPAAIVTSTTEKDTSHASISSSSSMAAVSTTQTEPKHSVRLFSATTSTPLLIELKDEKNQTCRFREIKAEKNENSLFEALFTGLQHHRKAALSIFKINHLLELQQFVNQQLIKNPESDSSEKTNSELQTISQTFKIRIVVYKEGESSPIETFGPRFNAAIFLYHHTQDNFYHRLEPTANIRPIARRHSWFAATSPLPRSQPPSRRNSDSDCTKSFSPT